MTITGKTTLEWPPIVEGHTFLRASFPPEPIILDFGVNHGRFALEVIQRYNATVYGAEPVSQLFQGLPKHERLRVANAAVTGRDMDVEINVFEEKCASIMKNSNDALIGVEKVPGFSLKSFMEKMGVERADLAKVDVEGAEIDLILEAPEDVIRKVDQYTVEFHDFVFPRLKDGVAEATRKMRNSGYVCIKFSLDNTNVVFIKRELLSPLDEMWLRVPVRFAQGASRRLGRLAVTTGAA